MDNLEKTENIGYTIERQTEQIHNSICVGHQSTQANTHDVSKTSAIQQITGGRDELNIVFKRKS